MVLLILRSQELQRILSRSLDILYSNTASASGLQTDCDFYLVIKTIEAQIQGWLNEWTSRRTGIGECLSLRHIQRSRILAIESDVDSNYYTYLVIIANFYYNYAMLVVNSFGLQNALERAPVNVGHFFTRCYSSAVACATTVKDELGPRGFLRYSPDSHFVQCSYAVLSLLKVSRNALFF